MNWRLFSTKCFKFLNPHFYLLLGFIFPLLFLTTPIVFLIYWYMETKADHIRFFKLEAQGSALLQPYLTENYLNSTQQLLKSLHDHLNAAKVWKTGELSANETDPESLILQLDSVNKNFLAKGDHCNTFQRVESEYRNWILNNSNLILDPQLAPYKLMDLHFLLIPELKMTIYLSLCQRSFLLPLHKHDLETISYLSETILTRAKSLETILKHSFMIFSKQEEDKKKLSDYIKHLHRFQMDLAFFKNSLLSNERLVAATAPEAPLIPFFNQLVEIQNSGLQFFDFLNQKRIESHYNEEIRILLSTLLVWIISFLVAVLFILKTTTVKKRFETLISEQQKALVRSLKLATVGELTSGLGHEVGNYVTVLSISAKNLESELKTTRPDLLPYVQRIGKLGTRIHAMIKSMKTLIHPTENSHKESLLLKDIIDESLFITDFKIKRNKVKVSIDESISQLRILGNETELCQVLVNLLSNGIDAVKNSTIRELFLTATLATDNKVILAVQDSGPGIPEDIRGAIFESFITTKPAGEGTGLGLSISKQLIERMNGQLRLVPTKEGARFEIELPKG